MSGPTGTDQEEMTTSERLREALVAITVDGAMPTASALCKSAGVSRNALYRYHPDVLEELHKLQRQRRSEPSSSKRRLEQLQNDNDALKLQVAQLAALVDHYFAAWQEVSSLLKRREHEFSSLRKAKVVPIQR